MLFQYKVMKSPSVLVNITLNGDVCKCSMLRDIFITKSNIIFITKSNIIFITKSNITVSYLPNAIDSVFPEDILH